MLGDPASAWRDAGGDSVASRRKKTHGRGKNEKQRKLSKNRAGIEGTKNGNARRRSRSMWGLDYAELSSDGENAVRYVPQSDGPPVERVLAKDTLNNRCSRYLVKWIDKAYVHSTVVDESDLMKGSLTQGAVKEFVHRLDKFPGTASNLGSAFVEPWNGHISVAPMFIDRIVGHRRVEENARIPNHMLGPGVYVPGLPLESIYASEALMKWASPLYDTGDEGSMFLRADGVLSTAAERLVPEDGVIELMDTEMNGRIEYLVKWRDIPATCATWEGVDTITGLDNELFVPANVDELSRIIDVYRGRARKVVSKSALRVPEECEITSYNFGCGVIMNEEQVGVIRGVFNAMIQRENCRLIGHGRVFAVSGFVEMLKGMFDDVRPVLIVTGENGLGAWKTALRIASALCSVEYVGNQEDRLFVRENELDPMKFDVLITSAEIVNHEDEFIASFDWSVVVIDDTRDYVADVVCLSQFFSVSLTRHVRDELIKVVESPRKSVFSYKEEIVFAENSFCSLLYRWVRKETESRRPGKDKDRCDMNSLAAQIVLTLTHPFMSPGMRKVLIDDKRQLLDLREDAPLRANHEVGLFKTCATKLAKLKELVNDSRMTSVVVATNLAVLRMLYEFSELDVRCVILNSHIKDESMKPSFDKGVIFATRDTRSPLLLSRSVDQIVFYDVGPKYTTDVDFVQFLKPGNPNILVRRIILAKSAEADLFAMSVLDPDFNCVLLPDEEAEKIIRVACLTACPAWKSHDQVEIDFKFPEDAPRVRELIRCAVTETYGDDFWSRMFASVKPSKVIPEKLTTPRGIAMATQLSRMKFTDWENIASVMNVSAETARRYGRGMILYIVRRFQASRIPYISIGNAVVWCEFHGLGYTCEFDGSENYWMEVVSEDASSHNFGTGKIGTYLNARADEIMMSIEKCAFVRAFLELRDERYFPPRYLATVGDKYEDICLFRKILVAFVEHGDSWSDVAVAVGMSAAIVHAKFNRLYSAIVQDVLSYILHESEETKKSFGLRHPFLPIIVALENGPFVPTWTEVEQRVVLRCLSEFAVPLDKHGLFDWCEFHALTQMTTKSTAMIERFTSYVMQKLQSSTGNVRLSMNTLSALKEGQEMPSHVTVTNSSLAIGEDVNVRLRLAVLSEVRQVSMNLPTETRVHEMAPRNWTVAHDRALVEGICQFGFSRVGRLPRVDHEKYGSSAFDLVISTSLGNFESFFSDVQNVMRRLRFVVTSSLPVKRRVVFWGGPVRQISFHVSNVHKSDVERRRQRRPIASHSALRTSFFVDDAPDRVSVVLGEFSVRKS